MFDPGFSPCAEFSSVTVFIGTISLRVIGDLHQSTTQDCCYNIARRAAYKGSDGVYFYSCL
jgi:hypothetical protein